MKLVFPETKLKMNWMSEDKSEVDFDLINIAPGLATALANSLRMSLLSTIPSYAATAVNIASVVHDCSPIPGVEEDMPRVIANINNIIIKNNIHYPELYLSYTDQLQGPLRLKDLTIKDAQQQDITDKIKLGNPELVILNKVDSRPILMTIIMTMGTYNTFTRDKKLKNDFIQIDPNFNPVLSARCLVEDDKFTSNCRSIHVNIRTNGAVKALDCFVIASHVLQHYLLNLTNLVQKTVLTEVPTSPLDIAAMNTDKQLEDMQLEQLPLETATYNNLKYNNINNLRDVITQSHPDKQRIKQEIIKALEESGIGVELKDLL